MKDTIYREDAINCLCNGKCLDEMRWCDDGYCPPVTRIKQLPSAQPKRMRGKWINAYPDIEPNPMFMYGICSVCGFEQSISNKLNYCPNCGAEMEGEQDETNSCNKTC